MGSRKTKVQEKDNCYRPSVSTDIILFLIREEPNREWRREPEKRLSVLLVRRGLQPFQGCWALPGGFLHEGETLEQCAAREVSGETGVLPRLLLPCGVYDSPDRDPRERVITHAFTGIMNGTDIQVHSGEDAGDAAWFDLKCEVLDDGLLRLSLCNGKENLSSTVRKQETAFGETQYACDHPGDLAFDHAAILAGALGQLQKRIEAFENVFSFMPPRFTLSSLQNVIETVCGMSYTPANFRRKIAPYVEETEEFTCGIGHRPARLYRKKEQSKGERV